MEKLLEFDSVSLDYAGRPVLAGMSFSLAPGEIACLLGASGCGKTSALRCIAGFETPSAGAIRLGGETMAGEGVKVPAHRRRVGMVFQDHALFPHLTAAENVAFGLSALSRAGRRERVSEALALVGLGEEAGRYPHQLSGGQQQRVALARALAPRPRLLALDEPFSNLDAELRERLAREVRDVLKRLGIAALMVTHDQHEAFAFADTVGVMHGGRLQQWDAPEALYRSPASRYVAGFIGQGAFLPGRAGDDGSVMLETGALRSESGLPFRPGAEVEVLLRPDEVKLEPRSALQARVLERMLRGSVCHYVLALPSGRRLLAELSYEHPLAVGERVGIKLQPKRLLAFSA
ncbi:ABC transporter ATP-binding protein [Chromobacterium sp. IIBBL 290-4]|uniref:ABC transporter ATP-binding protein n=1 Tax=Chromobacterium sp. IIBBL 290-4 TaxID=2953890 RepID=UPI0020B6EEC5|nr:ABC transporter ATP-binding protein [Chromobacterium sp. IIBBL 290-4]UTH74172.1 ABC transporter ATP-binding protein [Chromobacterium sp. IIBBL 290-4]